jgi:tetratricopeptide (TPR) repeat protein
VADNPRIEELRRRVQADPASIAFAALAEEFRRIGRYDDAIATCRTGLVRHPAYLSARVTLGRALIETGEFDAARHELETVLRSAPENIAATRGLALITERLGQSGAMDPGLAAIAEAPVPAPAPAASPSAPPPPKPAKAPVPSDLPALNAAGPISLDGLDLPLSAPSAPPDGDAFDLFAQALERSAAPVASAPAPEPAPAAAEPPPIAFEGVTIAFEAPVMPEQPHPHVAALPQLERLLDAIRTARHA